MKPLPSASNDLNVCGAETPPLTIAVRGAVAVVAWFALAVQLVLTLRLKLEQGGTLLDGLAIYLGYFTVLTNLFIATIATALWRRPRLEGSRRIVALTGCASVSIVLVGIAYHLLLRHVWDPQGAQWLADVLLHYAVPVLALVHWLLWRPAVRLGWAVIGLWCLSPTAYLVVALLRGGATGWYPYPFLNVDALGWSGVGVAVAGLLAGFLSLAALAMGWHRRVARRRAAAAGHSTD